MTPSSAPRRVSGSLVWTSPERGEPCFNEATERLRELAGGTLRVGRGPRAEDRYGRSLFYVYTQYCECIDETLVRGGLALAVTWDGQHRGVLEAAETRVRRDGGRVLVVSLASMAPAQIERQILYQFLYQQGEKPRDSLIQFKREVSTL